jgi:hypothetical protein
VQSVQGVSIEHSLLDAMRVLMRERWSANVPGGRVWISPEGTYLFWKIAVEDITNWARAAGIQGLPQDPDTLASILMDQGLLLPSPNPPTPNRKHYHRIVITAPKVPKVVMECVQLKGMDLLGLHADQVSPVQIDYPQGEIDPATQRVVKDSAKPAQTVTSNDDDTSEATPSKNEAKPDSENDNAEKQPPKVVDVFQGDETKSKKDKKSKDHPFEVFPKEEQAPVKKRGPFVRYGAAAPILESLANDIKQNKWNGEVCEQDEGLVLRYPEVLKAYAPKPAVALDALRTQGLLVNNDKGQEIWRIENEGEDPFRAVVLNPRFLKHLKPEQEPSREVQ